MYIKKMILTPNSYSRPQFPLTNITKIAIHYVGNAGTSAIANRNYFNNLANTHSAYASSHYIIGLDGEIIQCIPECEISCCTNSANRYSISIECCHPNSDGKFNTKTINSLIELCSDICIRYKLDPLTDIIRHYDVTGKKCPLYWVEHPEDFEYFKQSVKKQMGKGDENLMFETINITVNGKEIKADAIIKNDTTFIKLRSLENAGFNVSYNAANKMRKLDNIISKKFIINGVNKTPVYIMDINGKSYVSVDDIKTHICRDLEISEI